MRVGRRVVVFARSVDLLRRRRFGLRRLVGGVASFALVATGLVVTAGSAGAAVSGPPFGECPSVGYDSSCGILIDITDSGTSVLADPSQPPYDGIEDTLIGVLNESSHSIDALALHGPTDLFGFDGDGICGYTGNCFGPSGYEGPNTSFSDVSPDATSGVVNFPAGLAPGASTYFALEESLTASDVQAGTGQSVVGVHEQGMAPNQWENTTTCSTGQPVNCATGEFWHSFTDISVPGRGVALNFGRTYNSINASVNGPLGFGWSDSYAISLAVDGSGNVTVTQGGGASVTFSPWYSGYYTAPSRVFASLVKNSDGSYTLTDTRSRTVYEFSSAGQLLSETDRNGETTTLAYTGGVLSTVTDPAGRQLAFSYDSNGHVAKVADPAGRSVSFGYDAAGDLTSATDVGGGVTTFGYDANHQLTTMTDPRGGTTTNVYDAQGRVVSQADPMGRTTTFAYSGDPASAVGSTTTITDPRGIVTSHTYSQLELLSVTKGVGTAEPASWQYAYDPFTLGVAAVTDPNGHTTHYTYDRSGNVLTVTDPLGRTTNMSYNGLNEPTSVTDAAGNATYYDYDGAGNLSDVSRPLYGPPGSGGGVIADTVVRPAPISTALSAAVDAGTVTSGTQDTQLVYGDPAHPGDVTAVIDPNGNQSTFSYDADGDLITSTDPLGNTTTSTFDGAGRQLTSVTPRGNTTGADPAKFTTTYTYNAFGDLTKTVDPLGHVSSVSYDADRNQVSTTDANGNTSRSTYDADNELATVTRADGSAVSYGYDADGNQTAQADAAGNTTHYSFDALNRVNSVTDPLGQVTTYGYDPAGNKTSTTDPRGVVTTTSYDAANELISTSYSDGTPAVTYTYTPNGQRASMVDGTGTTTYTYDSLNRLSGQTDGAGQQVGYGYDLAGHLTSLTYPNGQTVTRGYDAAGRLTSVTDWLGNTTTISPDADGNPTSETYGNGVLTTSTFDDGDQLATMTDTGPAGQALASFGYTRDNNGQVTATTSSGVGQPDQSYTYTALNQLRDVNSAALSYDPAGDITTLANGASLTYNAAGEATSMSTGGAITTFGYDAAGDRTTASGGTDTSAAACGICVLAPTGNAALSATGTAHVTSSGVITVDSSSPAAISATGSASITAGHLYTAGTAKVTGTAKITPAAASGSTPDPLAGATPPSVSEAPTALRVSGSTSATAQPGVYSSISVSGNATLTLAPGDYVLAGGDLTVSGAAHLNGAGVTIYLGCASYPAPCAAGEKGAGLAVSGAATLTLNGPAYTSGITVFSDPNNSAAITVSGSPGATIAGNLYAPAAQLAVTGNGTLDVAGTVVAGQVNVTGSAKLSETAPSHSAGVTYTYDAAHRLTQVKTPTTTTSYGYDGDGRRAGTTTAAGAQHYAWDLAGGSALLLTDGATSYLYDDNGLPIEQIDAAGAALYYQHDQLGSTRLLTDSTGGVVATYSYDPYGQLTTHTGTADTSLRFAGQYQDPTGLYYLQARYYDPATAQFLTVDPLAGLTQQPYSYAGNNPLTFTDPLGLCIICWKTISRVANDVTNVAGVVAVAAVVTVLVVGTDGAAAPILLSIAGYAGDVALAGSVTAGVSTCYGAATTPGANFDDCYVAAGDALIAGATFGVGRSVEYSILEAQHLAAEDMQRAFLEYAAATATGPAITAGRWGLNKLLNAWETTGATAC